MRKRKWTESQLHEAVSMCTSVRQVLKHIGLVEAGGNYELIKRHIERLSIPTKHFTGKAWNKGKVGLNSTAQPLSDLLTTDSTYQSYKLKKRLFKEGLKTPKCEECAWAKTSLDGRIPVELDHINGCKTDNRLENLRILCPNCHSLKLTHRGMNKRKG